MPHRFVIVAGLLAALLPAATTISGRQPEGPCDPTVLAKHVIRFCAPAPETPTAQCCELVAAVDLGGGVPCLFRVAAEPHVAAAGVNFTTMLHLYNFCGGGNLGALLPATTPISGRQEAPPCYPALLPATTPISGRQEAPPCYPALLATRVLLFCSPADKPTAECCKPVLSAVDLGGGVPCLFRVAAEAHLASAAINMTTLAKLYKACGGLLHGGANLAATCEAAGPAHPGAMMSEPRVSAAPSRPQLGDRDRPKLIRRKLTELCDPFPLASSLAASCGQILSYPAHPCCVQVLRTVDEDCVCGVIEIPELMVTGFGVEKIWEAYGLCGGTRPIPNDHSVCTTGNSPPPPPPPASTSPPSPTSASTDPVTQKQLDKLSHTVTEISAISFSLGGLLAASIAGAFAIWKWQSSKNIPTHQLNRAPRDIEMVDQSRIQAVRNRVRGLFRRQAAPVFVRSPVPPATSGSTINPASSAHSTMPPASSAGTTMPPAADSSSNPTEVLRAPTRPAPSAPPMMLVAEW